VLRTFRGTPRVSVAIEVFRTSAEHPMVPNITLDVSTARIFAGIFAVIFYAHFRFAAISIRLAFTLASTNGVSEEAVLARTNCAFVTYSAIRVGSTRCSSAEIISTLSGIFVEVSFR